MPDVKDLVEHLARGLVDQPAEVHVSESEEGGECILEVSVAPDDLGKVIGRAGRTARALRLVAGAAAAKAGRRCRVEILD